MDSLLSTISSSGILLKIFALIVLLIAIKILLYFLKLFLPALIKKNKIRYRIQDVCTLICGLIFIACVVIFFAADVKTFAIPFSVIGAGIAFSLQEMIASIAGRIVIVVTSLYQVGDRIQIGNVSGDVIHIGFMRTSLMEIGNWVKADQYSGRIVHVTNATVLKENVENYSDSFPFVWDEIIVPVRYGSDQHLARSILLAHAKHGVEKYLTDATEKWKHVQEKYMIATPSFTPAVTLIANDNWLEFTVRYVVAYDNRRHTKDKLFSSIVDAFSKTDGKVAFASMTIEITQLPKMAVGVS